MIVVPDCVVRPEHRTDILNVTSIEKEYLNVFITENGVNLFSQLLSVSREQDVDMQNILSCELCALPLDFLTFKWCCKTHF